MNHVKHCMSDSLFDILVIDECAQSTEPCCWIAAQHCKKLVMAGDHKQLDPTVKCNAASAKGLSLSIFERVMLQKGEKTSTMLVEQYRMNENIMQWSSDAMYEGKLIANEGVKDRLIDDIMNKELIQSTESELLSQPLLIIDTAGSLMHEGLSEKVPKVGGLSESKYNAGETDLVIQTINELTNDLGLKGEDIGVITPYNA